MEDPAFDTRSHINTPWYLTSVTKRLTRAERREQTRLNLVEAAITLFANQGVPNTSVEAIAEKAGYSRGAYHGNFSRRDELLDAVVEVVVSDLAIQLRERTGGHQPAIAKLTEYIRTYTTYCAREPERARALVAIVSYRTTTRGDAYMSMVDESLEDLTVIFEHGQETGEMRRFDRVIMARLLRRALDGEVVRIAAEGSATPIADELATSFAHATRASSADDMQPADFEGNP